MKRVIKAPGACCSVLLLLLLALLVTCAPAWAATYVVAKNGTGTDENIIYSADAVLGNTYTKLSELLAATTDGDTVSVGQGTYTVSETLNLKKGVKLIGAGAENTILHGGGVRRVIQCTEAGATTDNTLFSGFRVTGGNARGGGRDVHR